MMIIKKKGGPLVLRKAAPSKPGHGHPGNTDNPGDNIYRPVGTMGHFCSIDPGLGGTGWAIWRRDRFDRLERPVASGSINIADKNHDYSIPWWIRADRLASQLYCIVRQEYQCFTGFMELPAFMEGADVGMVTARTGDLIKLTSLFGIIAGRCFAENYCCLAPVEIVRWKGQLSKDKCHRRIRKKLPDWEPTTGTTHEMDAVGIGLHVKGFF